MKDKCGVVGVKDFSGKAALQAYYGLYALQHRGQEGAGIVSFDGFKQHTKKGLGLVGEVFRENDLEELRGESAIGHVRYPTSGSIDEKTVHPFNANTKQGFLALGHNGNLVNTETVREDLEKAGHVFTTDTDTEVLVHDLARNLIDNELPEAARKTLNKIKGAYSTTLIYNGGFDHSLSANWPKVTWPPASPWRSTSWEANLSVTSSRAN
ncbi:MAG: class II glutamine amidotransferase [Candidatus Bipolaricaulia bacterium]